MYLTSGSPKTRLKDVLDRGHVHSHCEFRGLVGKLSDWSRGQTMPCAQRTPMARYVLYTSRTEHFAYRRKVYPPTNKAIWFTLSSAGSARAGTWGRHSNGLANVLSNTYQGTSWIQPASRRRNAVVVRLKTEKTPRKIIRRPLLAIWQQTRSAAWPMTTLILRCWHAVGRNIILTFSTQCTPMF